MTMNEYQEFASRTINQSLSREQCTAHALHEIAAECGEIHSIFQKRYQGHDINYRDLSLEIGDLLWGIAELCTAHGWSLEDIAQANIDKLKKRYPDGFSSEKSLNRDNADTDSMNPVERRIFRTFCKR